MYKDQIRDILQRSLDNTAPESQYKDLGILYFARTFFDRCNLEQPLLHYQLMKNALELFDPNKTSRPDRQCYVIVHRGAAKSTLYSYVLPLYLICAEGMTMAVRVESPGWEGSGTHDYDIFTYDLKPEFIEIFSETHGRAENFTMNIRTTLETNEMLKSIFGPKSPRDTIEQKGTLQSNTWRRDNFITANKCIVYGNGTGQQARGILIEGRRPSLAIFDDIYSEQNTLTEQGREKIRSWFHNEAIASVDPICGKVLTVGTMVHEDTIFTEIQKSSQWYGYNYPIIGEEELARVIQSCKLNYAESEMILPSEGKIAELQTTCETLSWPNGRPLSFILKEYQRAFEIGKTSYFYQEYLNRLVSPEDQKFDDGMVLFTDVNVWKETGSIWVSFMMDDIKWVGAVEPVMAVDPASSESKFADDTAIVVGGKCRAYPIVPGYDFASARDMHPNKQRGIKVSVLIDSYLGKMDIYDNPVNHKRGIANVVEEFAVKYNVRQCFFETMGQQGIIARDVQRYLVSKKSPCYLTEYQVHGQNKIDRIESILLPEFQRSRKVIMAESKNSRKIWSQIKYLAVSQHDDGADAFSTVIYRSRIPIDVDYEGRLEKNYTRSINFNSAPEIPNWEVV